MLQRTFSNELRRPKTHHSAYIFNYVHERNPWTVVWWSAAFPGSGHLILCKFFSGALLMLWEFYINVKAHINEAIVYSMIGKFELAKTVIDPRWFLLYSTVYIFAMWDCYSTTLDLNKYSQLADRFDSPIMPFNIGSLEINYLDNRKPWNGAIWSLLNPGLGSIYSNSLPKGFFVLICFIVTVYNSNLLPAIHVTLAGNAKFAGTLINKQWFLNLPSIILFSASSTFQDILNTNELYKVEQSRFLKEHYQPTQYTMPKKNNKRDSTMHFISTFLHNTYLELALSDLEKRGISKENIFVAALEKYSPKFPDIERVHKEAPSKFELAFILGAIFMLLGGIYGFIWDWGPIIWSLIGLVFGAILGVLFSLILYKTQWVQKKNSTEVVLIVECENSQSDLVEEILWGHKALGVTKTS